MKTYAQFTIGKANIERETTKAVLINGVWFPKSQIELTPDDPDQPWMTWTLEMPFWLAKKNGLLVRDCYYNFTYQLIER